MTLEELKLYNGKDGNKAYIAYKGKVYDVTESSMWKDGEHEGLHYAGTDLTSAMKAAPHGAGVFKKFSVVGELEKEESSSTEAISTSNDSLERFKTWYQSNKPHPATVHFPIALHFFAAFWDILFLLNHSKTYEAITYYSFLIATVMGALAMVTGIISWWLNYNFSHAKAFLIKLYLAITTLVLGIIGVAIHAINPNVAYELSFEGILYHFTILITVPTVIIMAYYGGKIAWGNKQRAIKESDEKPQEDKPQEKKVQHKPSNDQTLPQAKEFRIKSDDLLSEGIGYPFIDHNTKEFFKQEKFLKSQRENDFSILISGPAGAGIKTIETVLLKMFKHLGFEVFSSNEYMSRVRGGSNSTFIRFGDSKILSQKWYPDIVVALDKNALLHVEQRINENTTVLADVADPVNYIEYINIDAKTKAEELGRKEYANTILAGMIIGLLEFDNKELQGIIEEKFKKHSPEDNIKAFALGCELSSQITSKLPSLPKAPNIPNKKLLLDGTTACGFGFLAGGCNFISSYPMSPSTGVLNFMAKASKDFTILVEQVEDEIGSLNMVLGSWFAGGRAMTTTSGGGFALMCETMSLSGVSETPAVIYLAQRPGPATGMPTRTEQGDLNLVLYSGHGEFARLILAPGDMKECIELSYLCFELADRFQIPAVLLIDQYLAEINTTHDPIDMTQFPQRKYITKSDKKYQRYKVTENGISPRAIPAYGEGIVYTDSHEHDESGHITESYELREKMIQKRKAKEESLKSVALKPYVYGKGSIALVGWGSTKGLISEVIEALGDERLYQIHYFWIHPLSEEALSPLKEVDRIIMIENNSDAQFTKLLKQHDIDVDHTILQSNGFAFFSDQLTQKIQIILQEVDNG